MKSDSIYGRVGGLATLDHHRIQKPAEVGSPKPVARQRQDAIPSRGLFLLIAYLGTRDVVDVRPGLPSARSSALA
jgi:hypothetical protein